MADFVASTALRDIIADHLETDYYWATLHDDTGGFVAGDVYSAGVRGELVEENGYLRGAKAITLTHTGGTGGVLDGPDLTWSASGGEIGPASYAAIWMNTTNNITGAVLVSVDDKAADPQTATDGNTMTFTIVDPVTIATPA